MPEAARTCPKCPSVLVLGGTPDRPFWVCPECHMAFLSPALMGHAEAAIAARP
jgi:ribosomal protein S27AE